MAKSASVWLFVAGIFAGLLVGVLFSLAGFRAVLELNASEWPVDLWQAIAGWVAAVAAALAGLFAGIGLLLQRSAIQRQSVAIKLQTQQANEDSETTLKADARSVGFKVSGREILDVDDYEERHVTRYKYSGIVVSSRYGPIRNATISIRTHSESNEVLNFELFNHTIDHKGVTWTNFKSVEGLMFVALLDTLVPNEILMFELTTSPSIGFGLELDFWFVDQFNGCWRISTDGSGLQPCEGSEAVAIPGGSFYPFGGVSPESLSSADD